MSIESRPELGAFLRRGGYSAVLCVAIALLLGAQPGARFGVSLVHSLAIGSLCWFSIDGGRFVVARWLARRDAQRLDAREGWPGWGWMSLIIALGVPVAYVLGSRAADLIIGSVAPAPDAMPWRRYALPLLITVTASAVATGFFATRSRLFHARAEAEAARRAASEMQLRLLQAQLEPHMLFNTLANLRVLIGADPARAQAMLDRLIAFLRATLSASRSAEHALAAEFERLADYLALMAIRLGPRLEVRLDLPDALRALPVPPLLMQPLVENAIRHGIEPRLDGGRIEVSARRDGARLLLEVRDSGAGLTDGAAGDGSGFGLQQVRERLTTLYGGRAGFTLEAGAGGGALARIELPCPT